MLVRLLKLGIERNETQLMALDINPFQVKSMRGIRTNLFECLFYEPTGRLTVFDILGDYRGYQQFKEAWQAYKELDAEVHW
jgi:hypothetical protein